MIYFHYADDDFKVKQKGEDAKLYGFKRTDNRRSSGQLNKRHSNIVKSNLSDYVEGKLYNISDEEKKKFEDSEEIELIQVIVRKEDKQDINAFTFHAKPKWTFGDGRIKTDFDTNLTGQMLGSDQAIQRDNARTNVRERKVYNFSEFKKMVL